MNKIFIFILLIAHSNLTYSKENNPPLNESIDSINKFAQNTSQLLSTKLVIDKMGYNSLLVTKPFLSEIIFTGCKSPNDHCVTASLILRLEKPNVFDIGRWNSERMFSRLYETQNNKIIMQTDLHLGSQLSGVLLNRYVSTWIENGLNLINETGEQKK